MHQTTAFTCGLTRGSLTSRPLLTWKPISLYDERDRRPNLQCWGTYRYNKRLFVLVAYCHVHECSGYFKWRAFDLYASTTEGLNTSIKLYFFKELLCFMTWYPLLWSYRYNSFLCYRLLSLGRCPSVMLQSLLSLWTKASRVTIQKKTIEH